MYPIIHFTVLNYTLTISSYVLCIGIGGMIAIILFDKNTKFLNRDYVDYVLYAFIFSFFIGTLFSWIICNIFKFGTFKKVWVVSFMPAISISFIFFSLCLALKRYPILDSLNLIIPYVVLVHAWGRIGCFCAGCCFGKPTNFFTGVVFPPNSLPFNKYGNVPVHPTQLYESAFLFTLFFVLNKIPKYFRFVFYLLSYGIVRFIIEFFRGDDRFCFFINRLSSSQELCILWIILSFNLWIYIKFFWK